MCNEPPQKLKILKKKTNICQNHEGLSISGYRFWNTSKAVNIVICACAIVGLISNKISFSIVMNGITIKELNSEICEDSQPSKKRGSSPEVYIEKVTNIKIYTTLQEVSCLSPSHICTIALAYLLFYYLAFILLFRQHSISSWRELIKTG